jgi:hypothetical protein
MKKSELRQIIKEEISKILVENETKNASLSQLTQALNKLPNSIKYLKVPTEVNLSNSKDITLYPSKDVNFRKTAIKYIKDAIAKSKQDKGPFTFELKSYTKPTDTSAYYIQIESDASKQFASAMSKGQLGSLD